MLQPSVTNPRLIEDDRFGRHTGVKRQLEFLRGREGVNVMADVVAVRKRDRRADLDRADVGHELLVLLIDHGRARRGDSAPIAQRLRVNDRVRHRRAFAVSNDDVQTASARADEREDARRSPLASEKPSSHSKGERKPSSATWFVYSKRRAWCAATRSSPARAAKLLSAWLIAIEVLCVVAENR